MTAADAAVGCTHAARNRYMYEEELRRLACGVDLLRRRLPVELDLQNVVDELKRDRIEPRGGRSSLQIEYLTGLETKHLTYYVCTPKSGDE